MINDCKTSAWREFDHGSTDAEKCTLLSISVSMLFCVRHRLRDVKNSFQQAKILCTVRLHIIRISLNYYCNLQGFSFFAKRR
jgi:hypothetical protein